MRLLALPLALLCVSVRAEPQAGAGVASQTAKPVRQITVNGFHIGLDLSSQMLSLRIRDARGLGGDSDPEFEAPIAPTLSGAENGNFVSASMLAMKAKQFDDGLYAAVELAAQQGVGVPPLGKAYLLRSLAKSLIADRSNVLSPAPITVLAAAVLGKLDVDLPATLRPAVQQAVEKFSQDELHSKPISFYSWSGELEALFRQDRLLQTELRDAEGTAAIVKALQADKPARAVYEAYVKLISQLTNPPASPDLRSALTALDQGRPVPVPGACFFPPSRSHETDLIERLYGNSTVPEGFSLADEMIRQIRGRRLLLTPRPDSGWYDYQTWALEPLVIAEKMPEAQHLQFDPSYSGQLLELFKGILALTRETHAKNLATPRSALPLSKEQHLFEIRPELSVEPLATYYFRRAWSYYFVRSILTDTFGAPALEKLHRLTAAGPVSPNLADELRSMESLFYGAHVTVCREIGMPPLPFPADRANESAPADPAPFAAWQAKLASDSDVGQDARMMVPVFYDPQRRKTKVWLLLGWATQTLEAKFAAAPALSVVDPQGNPVADTATAADLQSSQYKLLYPVTAEVYVAKILNRDEFRRLCDAQQTRSAILAALR
jgi:hypothetical protein